MSDVRSAEIELSKIHFPENERKHFDPVSLATMGLSIVAHGVRSPIGVVKEADDRYRGIYGERRFRASALAGKSTIPCIIHPEPKNEIEAAEIRLLENLAREDLKPMEAARGLNRLLSDGRTAAEVAARVGMNEPAVSRSLSLLKLPPHLQKMIEGGDLNAAAGYELVKFDDPVLRDELARKCAAGEIGRDGLVALRKRSKTPEKKTDVPSAGPSRATMKLADCTVTVQAANLDLDAVIAKLLEAVARAKEARSHRLTLSTFLRTLRDTAGPQPS